MTAPTPLPAPPTPPAAPPSPSFYARFSVFGWLCVFGGGALLYLERASTTWYLPVIGLALVILGGVCVDRTPVVAFVTLAIDGIKAWRSHGDHDA